MDLTVSMSWKSLIQTIWILCTGLMDVPEGGGLSLQFSCETQHFLLKMDQKGEEGSSMVFLMVPFLFLDPGVIFSFFIIKGY